MRVDLGTDPLTGRRRQKTLRFKAAGAKAANARVAELVAELKSSPTVGSRATVAQMLEEFYRVSVARGRAPTTLHEYRRTIDTLLAPALGHIAIEKLTTHQLDSFYASLMTAERPLKPTSIRRYNAVLSAALSQAVKWEWIDKNPALRITLPEMPTNEIEAPTALEVRRIIEECQKRSVRTGMFVLVAAVTGCRRGEVAALRWRDIEGDTITVRASAYAAGGVHGIKSTKTGRVRKIVAGAALCKVLDAYRAQCEEKAREFEVEYSNDSFIFSSRPDGASPLNVDTISSMFHKVASELGLSHIHLHSLRHFAATELISSGLDIKDAASRLGHANPAMTLRVYAHATEERQRHAADIGDRIIAIATPDS
jgi:integrase